MADSAAKEVEIFVKNVYAQAESQQFTVSDAITVRTLKEMLQQAMPSSPPPAQQKIIFGGKICEDDHALGRILAGPGHTAPFVFHLMVPSAIPRSRPPTPETPRTATPTPTPPPTPTQTPTPTPTPTVTPTPTPPAATPAQFASFLQPPQAPVTVPTPTASHAEHQHQHQQLYMQAMLMQQQAMILSQIQYLQQLKAHQDQHTAANTTTPPAAAPHAGHFGHHFGHYHPPLYHPPHAAGAAPPATAPAPAAAPPRERGPVAQAFREILPLLDPRLAMKMAFMLFIIGQDTPTDRLIVLALMSFVAYLHITGVLGKILDLVQRAQAANQANNADANPVDANANAAAPPRQPGDQRTALTRLLRISSDRGLVQDVRYFVVGLLLSLVPAWHPQPLNGGEAAAPPEPRVPEAELPMQGI